VAEFDLHTQFAPKCLQSYSKLFQVQFSTFPRGLERHTELAAGDLFFQGLNVGVLLEKKIGDPGDNPCFVAPNHRDSGEFPHKIPDAAQLTRIDPDWEEWPFIIFYNAGSIYVDW
jgi:hypothetical protein